MVTVYNNRRMRPQTRSAVARAKEAVEIAKSNIPLIGPTACGKTCLPLCALAAGRYRYRRDAWPWELALSMRLTGLADPRVTGI
jgi:hypothetical protein